MIEAARAALAAAVTQPCPKPCLKRPQPPQAPQSEPLMAMARASATRARITEAPLRRSRRSPAAAEPALEVAQVRMHDPRSCSPDRRRATGPRAKRRPGRSAAAWLVATTVDAWQGAKLLLMTQPGPERRLRLARDARAASASRRHHDETAPARRKSRSRFAAEPGLPQPCPRPQPSPSHGRNRRRSDGTVRRSCPKDP